MYLEMFFATTEVPLRLRCKPDVGPGKKFPALHGQR